jgi:hypothetical protein
MRISVIHPSRSRPKEAFITACKWRDNANNEFEYILSIDSDDKSLQSYISIFYDYGVTGICHTNDNTSAIQAINAAAKIATGDLFVVISDDFDCPEHWDTLLLKELEGKSDFLLKTDDGNQPTCVTLPILDRSYYDRFGYIYNPDYKHMWSDTEMTAVAIMNGRFVKSDLKFDHLHYSFGKGVKDAINERNNATWQQGERLFNERLKSNFGIDNPVMPYSEIKWR